MACNRYLANTGIIRRIKVIFIVSNFWINYCLNCFVILQTKVTSVVTLNDCFRDWLPLIGLPEYVALFEDQGYCRIVEIQNFTWEDFEDIGIKKLGHLKRLGLAIKKIKVYLILLRLLKYLLDIYFGTRRLFFEAGLRLCYQCYFCIFVRFWKSGSIQLGYFNIAWKW